MAALAPASQTADEAMEEGEEADVKEDDPVVKEEGSKEPLAFPPLPPAPVAVEPNKGGSWGYQKSWDQNRAREPSNNFKDIFKTAMARFSPYRKCFACGHESYINWLHGCRNVGCTATSAARWEATRAGMALLTIPLQSQQSQISKPLPPSRVSM